MSHFGLYRNWRQYNAQAPLQNRENISPMYCFIRFFLALVWAHDRATGKKGSILSVWPYSPMPPPYKIHLGRGRARLVLLDLSPSTCSHAFLCRDPVSWRISLHVLPFCATNPHPELRSSTGLSGYRKLWCHAYEIPPLQISRVLLCTPGLLHRRWKWRQHPAFPSFSNRLS